jgi:hypothetical protein
LSQVRCLSFRQLYGMLINLPVDSFHLIQDLLHLLLNFVPLLVFALTVLDLSSPPLAQQIRSSHRVQPKATFGRLNQVLRLSTDLKMIEPRSKNSKIFLSARR